MKVSFITWYPSCRRSDTIADALSGQSHLIHFFKFKQPLYAPLKYVRQTLATWRALREDRPRVVLVASPPVVAPMIVWAWCAMTKTPFIIDAHTGVFDDQRWAWLRGVSQFLSRRARATIVTNEHLATVVRGWGADPLVIGDVPVDFREIEEPQLPNGINVTVVNTFSPDEPLTEIISAARELPDVHFHVTGSTDHARQTLDAPLPANLRLTGWLTDAEYAGLLSASTVVMCLTTHDHTMQRGAYEAMSLGKPLVTSDWSVLREVFSAGTLHVDNSVSQIASAVLKAVERHSELSAEMKALAMERRGRFLSRIEALERLTVATD